MPTGRDAVMPPTNGSSGEALIHRGLVAAEYRKDGASYDETFDEHACARFRLPTIWLAHRCIDDGRSAFRKPGRRAWQQREHHDVERLPWRIGDRFPFTQRFE
ncbi:MAG: hypothetical protein HY262_07015 [Chloroflexi bacterium]|nr:hypothetical protein [Chloroflexota bacterium]